MRLPCKLFSVVVLLGIALPLQVRATPPEVGPAKIRPRVKISAKAWSIHDKALVVDGHNDLPFQLGKHKGLGLKQLDLRKKQAGLHTDIPRLRQGGVGAQFWAAYVSPSTAVDGTAVPKTMEQINLIHRMTRRYPDTFEMAFSAKDIRRIRKAGKIASLIGVEGGYSIGNSLRVLRKFHTMGVRYLTLTHSSNVDWADSATDVPRHNGLTKKGRRVIAEMNRLGMLIDISHVSARTMRDTLWTSRAPVIASHSSAYAVAEHSRNVPDDVLRAIRKNRGVVMVNFYSGFATPAGAKVMKARERMSLKLRLKFPDREGHEAAMKKWDQANPLPRGSIHDVVDHIEHIVKVAGIDHVGLGSDFDGIEKSPRQLKDVSCYPYITQELLNRGYSSKAIKKVLGGNVLRAMEEAQKLAKKIAGGALREP